MNTQDVLVIIDSRDAKKTIIECVSASMHETLTSDEEKAHSQVVLPLIEEALQKNNCQLSDIVGVEVRIDKGSFTGRRVGMVIATMLGALLHVPVNGVSADTSIEIPYEEDKWK